MPTLQTFSSPDAAVAADDTPTEISADRSTDARVGQPGSWTVGGPAPAGKGVMTCEEAQANAKKLAALPCAVRVNTLMHFNRCPVCLEAALNAYEAYQESRPTAAETGLRS